MKIPPDAGAGSLPGRSQIATTWLVLFACTLALYTPFLAAPYYLDDLLFYFVNPPSHLYDYLFLPGSASHLYRPGEAMIMTAIQTHFRLNAFPLHLVSITAHASLCCLVWIAALRLGFRRFEAVLACALMLVTQMGAPALLGNDTMSQAVSAALGTLSCVLLGIAYLDAAGEPSRKISRSLLVISAVSYFASLFFKETVLGLSLVIALFTALAALRKANWRERIEFAAARLAPYFVLTIIYFLFRIRAGMPISGSGEYKVSVGLNVFTNLAQFASAALSPISSVAVAVAARNDDFLVLSAAGLGLFIVAVIVMAGLLKSPRRELIALLVCWVFAGLFPAVLLQHVSELYVYNAAPAIALLFGLALGSLWQRGTVSRVAVAICSALLIVGQTIATRQKAAMMNANGQAAARLMATISTYIKELPPNSEILLTQAEGFIPRYSVYILNGISVLDIGNGKIGPIYGRPDVQVKFIDRSAVAALTPDTHRLVLELKNGILRPVV